MPNSIRIFCAEMHFEDKLTIPSAFLDFDVSDEN